MGIDTTRIFFTPDLSGRSIPAPCQHSGGRDYNVAELCDIRSLPCTDYPTTDLFHKWIEEDSPELIIAMQQNGSCNTLTRKGLYCGMSANGKHTRRMTGRLVKDTFSAEFQKFLTLRAHHPSPAIWRTRNARRLI